MRRIGLTLGTLAALAALTIPQPVSAQPQDMALSSLLTTIEDDALHAAIAAIGARAAPLDDEERTVRIAFPDGMRAVARRMACVEGASEEGGEDGSEDGGGEGGGGCKGLILLGYFSRPDDVPIARQQTALTRFGLEQNLASVVVNREGEHVVKAYVIFDGGITLENLIVRLSLFGESMKAYQTLLYGTGE